MHTGVLKGGLADRVGFASRVSEGESLGDIQVESKRTPMTFREYLGIFREYSGNIQGRFGEHSWHIP
jgi:hypothetical protein